MDVDPSCRGINQAHPDSSVLPVSMRGFVRYVSITFQRFYPHGILPVRVSHILVSVLPISPASDVVEASIKFPVFEVTHRHNAISARGIDQILELYPTLFPGGPLPRCRNWLFLIIGAEMQFCDLRFLHHTYAAGGCVSKDKFIKFCTDLR